MSMKVMDSLRSSVKGSVVEEGDDGYDEARVVYNAMIDRRPSAVVRCQGAADVAAVVRAAAEDGSDVAVRGGGHSVPGFGTADGAIVADLGDMTTVTVDPASSTAEAAGGATWGMFNEATSQHGLATTGGIISTTGVGGLTLGGGIGYLARGHGLSCDNLLSAEVVLADGRVVTASADEEPDLFWALRGGGGNFGVVTKFTFRLHPVAEIYGGPMFFELADGPAILAYFADYVRTAPREFGGFPAFQIAPALPFVPEDRAGEQFVAVVFCINGPASEAEKIVQGFRDVAKPVAEMVGPMPYPAMNGLFDGLVPPGLQHYWKAAFLDELRPESVAAHMEHGPRVPTVNSTVHFYPINGACHDVASDATAFGHRDANFALVIAGMWPDPAENTANTAWVKDYYAAIEPFAQPGGYINFASQDDQPKASSNYGANYERLRAVKREYDPDNVFHLNQNIVP
ncbi:FAD/FMN-containing dehydrogenase [Microbacterium sp. BE35]|uniref:FAD-binding oxidoreductase n=1 Tax=Microbacterium sp. BE35 TaxID=2817773 RepID=UPI002855099F|nr:FAD-binding oxidoreductase [Microbacterium sp. BE35]MDR7188323.1 FAD/FMN-containing dehydrogenase [Microbacterium sp. BE35]